MVSSIFLDWDSKHKYSFNEILPGLKNQTPLLKVIDEKPAKDRSSFEKQLLELSNNIMRFEEISYLKSLKLIPPNIESPNEEWISPFEFVLNGIEPNKYQGKILNALQQYLASRMEQDNIIMQSSLSNYEAALMSMPSSLFDIDNLKRERWLNQVNLFYISLAFYILSFIVLGISWMSKINYARLISYFVLFIGFIAHTYGIILRMIIMNRPPVSTLYESVLFCIIYCTFMLYCFRIF